MRAKDRARKLQKERDALTNALSELEIAHYTNFLSSQEYLERKHKLLNGKFEEDVLMQIDNQIEDLKTRDNLTSRAIMLMFIIGLVGGIFYIGGTVDFSGVTGLVTFNQDGSVTMPINKNYTTNSTEDLTFINSTSVKLTGDIYGSGQVWIYQEFAGQRKLVYYTDTRSQQLITGNVVAGGGNPNNAVLVNGTNSTNVTTTASPSNNSNASNTTQTTNQSNTTNNTNSTNSNSILQQLIANMTNSTNSSSTTVNNNTNTTNSTANVTNSTSTNSTNSTTSNATNSTNSTTTAQIILSQGPYVVGDNVSINITPNGAPYTLYITTPDGSTYFLNDEYWVILETGTHRLSALVTTPTSVERVTTTFYVTGPLDVLTGQFTNACVETCSMPEEPINLVIVLDNTKLNLKDVTYTPTITTQNTTNGTNATNNTNGSTGPTQIIKTITPPPAPNPRTILGKCAERNPNKRPSICFNSSQRAEFFPETSFTLVNSIGSALAVFDKDGNMQIKGTTFENAVGKSQEFDLVVRGETSEVAWIDALTGDLYIKGRVIANKDTLMWQSRQDYVISNGVGMYLGIFDAITGDLYLRGTVVEGGLG